MSRFSSLAILATFCSIPFDSPRVEEELPVRAGREGKEGSKRGAPPEVRVTPAGRGENGVLPTINSLLPLFLTLALPLAE